MDIIIVDDNRIFRETLQYYASSELNYHIVACFENAISFLQSNEFNQADIVLMDINMPGISGLVASKRAKIRNQHIKIIAITNFVEETELYDMVTCGIMGCVDKENVYSELPIAIEKVMNNGVYFPNINRN